MSTDRVGLPFRGLVSVSRASVAPDVLFAGWLQHAREIGLDDRQVTALLTLGREYDEHLYELRAEMTVLAESVRVESGRLDEAAVDARTAALVRRSHLFGEEEALYLDYLVSGHKLLTDDQVTTAGEVTARVRRADLAELRGALGSTLAAGSASSSRDRRAGRARRRRR